MNIAIVAGTANDIPFQIPADNQVRGYACLAWLFPDDKTWNVSPAGFEKVRDQTDVLFIIPGADPANLERMVEVAESFDGLKLVQDSDPPTGWLIWFPSIQQLTVRLFNLCDAVLTHSQNMNRIVGSFTSTPVHYFPEPSYLASHKETYYRRTKLSKRPHVVATSTLCATYNSRRNAITNYAILKAIRERLPDLVYGVMANTQEAHAGELHARETEVVQEMGLWPGLQFHRPSHREFMFDLYGKMALMINMDASNCVGHWHIDAAATGVPVVCSDFPDASRMLFQKTSFNPYDMDQAVECAVRLLTDQEFRKTIIQEAYQTVDNYSIDSVRQRFLTIIDAGHVVSRPQLPAPHVGPIVLEVGAGARPHEDVTHCLDINPHEKYVGDRVWISHDLRDLPMPLQDGSVSKIYMCHVLEHFPLYLALKILEDSHRLLRPGGQLHIELPNAQRAFEYAVEYAPDIEQDRHGEIAWTSVTKTLWADAGSTQFNQHNYGYNHLTLSRHIERSGFHVDTLNSEKDWAVLVEAHKPIQELEELIELPAVEMYQPIVIGETLIYEGKRGTDDRLELVQELIEEEISRDSVILDVGSHFGHIARTLALDNPNGLVLSLEANASHQEIQRRCCELEELDNVIVAGQLTKDLLRGWHGCVETIDMIMLFSVLHHFSPEDAVEILRNLQDMTPELIVEIPGVDETSACGHETVKALHPLEEHLQWNRTIELMGEVPSHTGDYKRSVYRIHGPVSRSHLRSYMGPGDQVHKVELTNAGWLLNGGPMKHAGLNVWNLLHFGIKHPRWLWWHEQASLAYEDLFANQELVADVRPWNLIRTAQGIQPIHFIPGMDRATVSGRYDLQETLRSFLRMRPHKAPEWETPAV